MIGTSIYGWNTINSILSIRTYINTNIILFPINLFSLLSSTIFRIFQSRCIIISSCTHLALTQLAGITFAGLIPCLAISFPVAHFISTKIFSDCIQVSTWNHWKGNSCTKSANICGGSSFTCVNIIYLLFIQFVLLQGALEHRSYTIWLFQASIFVDEIDQHLPVQASISKLFQIVLPPDTGPMLLFKTLSHPYCFPLVERTVVCLPHSVGKLLQAEFSLHQAD